MSNSELIDAVTKNDLDEVRRLLNNGADLNAGEGMTALMYAAQGGHFEVAKLLVENGADVNKKDRFVSYNRNMIDCFIGNNAYCGDMQ
jgi:ankyrin repeat protein